MISSGTRAQSSFICVSLNPAIDKRLRLDALKPGRVNRAIEAIPAPGGKSAHVAMVLRALGADPLWLGFTGGPNGDSLLQGLRDLSIRAEGVPTAAETRMNLEIVEENGLSVDFDLEPGQMQFVDNRALGHSRTAFVDYPEPERKRHLVRLWMRDHGRRAYPG